MLAVEHGSLTFTSGPVAESVDAGLTIFGPNQVKTDYILVAKKSITSLAALKGTTFAVSTAGAPDALLLGMALKKAHLASSAVHVTYSGSSSANFDALLSGRLDAAWVHISALTKIGAHLHVLAYAYQLAPTFADSFMLARPAWLKSHFALAEAIDLAWLAEAKRFDTNESSWIGVVNQYTKHADTTATIRQDYTQLKTIHGWPDNAAAFSYAIALHNVLLAKASGELKGAGDRPVSQLIDAAPWQAALKIFLSHESSY
jgi:ABC-type nitrate/sulfonate/bicarbonate transport system substrate-binding protein